MSELLNVINLTMQETQKLAKEQSVADTPIVVDGVTVIPISKVSCGFSSGGSSAKNKTTAGAGAKVTKTPLSFVAIIDGNLQILHVNAEDAKKKGIIGSLKPVIDTLKNKFKKKDEEKIGAE